MFFVFEMANNHMGSIEHGKLLIKTFGLLEFNIITSDMLTADTVSPLTVIILEHPQE